MDDFEKLKKLFNDTMTGDKLNPNLTELSSDTCKSLETSLTSLFENIFGLNSVSVKAEDKKENICKCNENKFCKCKEECQDNTVKNNDIDKYKDSFEKNFKDVDYKCEWKNKKTDFEPEPANDDLRSMLLNKYKTINNDNHIDYKQEIINKVLERLHGEPNIDFKYMSKLSKDDKVTIQVVLSDIPDIAKIDNIQLLLDIKEQLIKDYNFSDIYVNIANKRILYFYIVL